MDDDSDDPLVLSGRECVWCGQRPVTREHLVPRWLSRLMVDTWPHPEGYQQWTRFTGPDKQQRERAFSTTTLEVVIKSVCAGCNSGWMSQLESRCGPIITRLVRGEQHRLQLREQVTLARWCAKFCGLMNSFEANAVVNDNGDMATIAAKARAPEGQLIRIAYRASVDQVPLVLNVATSHIIPIEEAEAGGPLRVGPPNSFLATVGFGHFAFCVAGGPGFRNLARWRSPSKYPMTIWPPTREGLDWPANHPRISDQADLIAFSEAVYPSPEERKRLLQ